MTKFKTSLLSASAVAAATLLASAGSAQTTGVAVIDPSAAMLGVKAIGPAWKSVGDQYRAAYASAETRERTLETTILPLQKRLDANNDGRLDEAEAAAAQKANRPEVQQIVAAQQAAQNEIGAMIQPARLAQAWIIDQVKQRYRSALTTVANNKKLGLVVTTDTAAFATPTLDITDDVTAALDTALPTLTITPPANWQPDQSTVQLFQQFTQALQAAAARAQQQQGAAAPAAPGTRAPAPATTTGTAPKRDRNGDPIKQ